MKRVLTVCAVAATIRVEEDRYIGWPSVCRLANGELLAVFSGDRDSHICPWGKVRLIRSKDDGGKTWDVANEISLAPSHCGDLGYPCSTLLPDGDILTVYYQQPEPDRKPCLFATKWRVTK